MSATAAPEVTEVELVIGGMTCAACAARVQAKLNKVDGVTASVNLSTERAHITAPAHLPASALVAVVEKAGYTATLVGAVLVARADRQAADRPARPRRPTPPPTPRPPPTPAPTRPRSGGCAAG